MIEPGPNLMYRQFMRGLSGGITVLAIAGFFWITFAAWAADCSHAGLVPWTNQDVPPRYIIWAVGPALAVAAALLFGASRVRRKAQGFKYSDIRRASETHRRLSVRIVRTFLLVGAAEGTLCWLVAFLAIQFHREDLILPGVGLVVSLHFLPLGSIFRMRPYYAAGAAGAVISLTLLLIPASAVTAGTRWMTLGLGVAPIMWITAIYAIVNADALAKRWADVTEPMPQPPAQ